MNDNLLVLYEFVKRDFYVYRVKLRDSMINYTLIYPALFALSFGYILPKVGNVKGEYGSLIIFLGSILWTMMPVAFIFGFDLMLDLRSNNFICYQGTIISPWLVILERIFVFSLFCFISVLPVYPISLSLLGYSSLLLKINWLKILILFYLGSVLISIYHVIFMVFLPGPEKLDIFWRRFNYTLAILGGETVPRYVWYKFSPIVGNLILLNPFLYLTEGLKGQVIGSGEFIPFQTCIFSLIFFIFILYILAIYLFKKRVDHV